MKVDFEATRKRCEDRFINMAALACKHGISKTTMNRFMAEKLDGQSGQGVYGQIEYVLVAEGLLMIHPPRHKTNKSKIINILPK